ncbi:MAG: hypothetical protein N4A41_04025 [Crocinitomicaceae bacterium]|jgi:hypothetical protein|nr:hypothetical protein [Crocinitomicaceae bacterium]
MSTTIEQLLHKMNLKTEYCIQLIQAPEEIEELFKTSKIPVLNKFQTQTRACFTLIFVQHPTDFHQEIIDYISSIEDDRLLWFAYPKKSSKKYKATITRDNGWQPLGDHGFECVRSVSIDDNWTGMRFRKVHFIKKMSRKSSFAMSQAGKEKNQVVS